MTDVNGGFQFSVDGGDYVLSVRLEGWRCESESRTVDPASDVTNVDIEYEPLPQLTQVRVMDTTLVSLSLDSDGHVTVSVDPLYIGPGECVFWTSDVGPWAVHFSPISPLTHRRIRGAVGDTQGGCAREDIFPGKYSYFVAVRGPDSSIYTEDPELIDENES